MEVKILRVYELNGILRVETECEYGKDNMGLSLDKKYKDPVTQEPRWKKEVANLLKAKYEPQLAKEKEIKEFRNTKLTI